MEIAVTFCKFPFLIYHFNNKRFLHGSTKFFSFPSVLYRSVKTSEILTRETGNLQKNKTNENGAVDVEGESEVVFSPSDDRSEVNKDLETNKNLNKDNPLGGDTKISLKVMSQWMRIAHQKKMIL